jgi:hypothetical protein
MPLLHILGVLTVLAMVGACVVAVGLEGQE